MHQDAYNPWGFESIQIQRKHYRNELERLCFPAKLVGMIGSVEAAMASDTLLHFYDSSHVEERAIFKFLFGDREDFDRFREDKSRWMS